MNEFVDVALKTQFSDMVHVKAQQVRSRLRDKVMIKSMSGDQMSYDGIGDIEATEITSRNQKVEFSKIEHLRRKISGRRFGVTLPIDMADVRGALLNPEGLYADAMVRALERQFDRVVVQAAFAPVYTGRDFETVVTASDDGVVTVDATSGLNYDKLLEINENFADKEVGTQLPESFVFAGAAKEQKQLMNETKLINGDYSREYVIDKGQVQYALGMEIVTYGGGVQNPILNVVSGTRDCIAMSTRAICVGISKDISIDIIDARSTHYETFLVQIVGQFGAVRTEGVLIQKVQTTA